MPFEGIHIRCTGRADGDLGSLAERGPSGPGPALEARRREIVDRPWSWLRQVHGARVVDVQAPGDHAGAEADAAVSGAAGVALAVLSADCAPIAFASPEGIIGVAHAGWRGVTGGVVAATVEMMRAKCATRIEASLGPCIHPACYEFSPSDLDDVAARLGDGVRAVTADGRPALDLPAAVRAAAAAAGAEVVAEETGCTACDLDGAGAPRWFSHRARGDEGRQAVVVWTA